MTEREINKAEAKFHSKLMKWLQYNKHLFPRSFLIETKVVRKGRISFPFAELSQKEERLLLQAKKGQILQTHSDLGGTGTNCDASSVGGGGYIFIYWCVPRNTAFYAIDIEDFIKERNSSKAKSLKLVRAQAVGKEYRLYEIY
jgi:hypothetical protein